MSDWKDRLDQKFEVSKQQKQETDAGLANAEEQARHFFTTTAGPALEEIKPELEKRGRTVKVYTSAGRASITVRYQDSQEIHYSVEVRISPNRVIAYPKYEAPSEEGTFTSEGSFRNGLQNYDALSITKDEIIEHFLDKYTPRT